MSWFRTMMHQVWFLRLLAGLCKVKWITGALTTVGTSHRHCPIDVLPLLPPVPISLQEPIIMWSFIIGGVGLAMPLVVPPIRQAMGYGVPTPKVPPPVRQVMLAVCIMQ
jgi:hypothetical protein